MDSLEFKQKAILELRPEGGFSLNGKGKVIFITEGLNEPTEAEIKIVTDRLEAEYDAQEYARNRDAEYPPMADQLDYMFHNGFDKWKEDIVQPVKDKYPKPE